jgi:4-amino-4-deoxy-L-arabinose transferase-like glycosyltransferase
MGSKGFHRRRQIGAVGRRFLSRLAGPGAVLPVLVVLMTLVTHGVNLFGYPYFENDEGVYTSQGWWLIHFGKLAPYTYWYDHSPFGWLQVGLWQWLTGGPFRFGFALYSTRIFMLLIAAASNLILYYLTVRVTKSRRLALLACLFLVFSPVAVKYHRRVLLDNIQTFWFLLSLYCLWDPRKRLSRFWLSGLAFGIAFLSKEITIIFFPAFLYAVRRLADAYQRRYALTAWIISAVFLVSVFPLLALLRGEFFPAGWFRDARHVSLIETALFQMQRGRHLPFWSPESDFRSNLAGWFRDDPIFFYLGFVALLGNLWAGRKSVGGKIILFLSFSLLLFFMRGGLVLSFYIVPFLPLMAIGVAQFVGGLGRYLPSFSGSERVKLYGRGFAVAGFVLVAVLSVRHDLPLYTVSETAQQLEGVEYVRKNLASYEFVVIDNFAFMDLRLPRKAGDRVFPNAEWFYKVEKDPEIRDDKLAGDWRNIDYILLSTEMLARMDDGVLPLLKQAYEHAEAVEDFGGSALLKVNPS